MEALTISGLARQGGVNLETIRYYEREGLLPKPPRTPAGYRMFPAEAVRRIRFIKRAQELGFSLEEISELLSLEDGTDRTSIRHIASERLGEIQTKLDDLNRMKKALSHLIHECEHTGREQPCPIIATLTANNH